MSLHNSTRTISVPRSEPKTNTRFTESERLFAWASTLVPTASQTFSKSRIQFPGEVTPDFLSHGKGGRVWDVDGNEYVDMVMGLLANVLGYCDPDVDAAIRDQLERGISFSLATRLEGEVAERLVDIIPCAEMVRFGKNGTDGTSAAVRISRAATGRNHVIALGYHGWQDWYVGATIRNKGVPAQIQGLTHKVAYNDLPELEQTVAAVDDDVACIILEPMSSVEPAPGYLEALRDLATRTGTVLVFDETVTGFRFALGGAQSYFGVTPDLCVLGKGMANGMPLSAIVGRTDLMREFEEVFFSGTFGGEALSLAAAKAVIDKFQREPVIDELWRKGAFLKQALTRIIDENHLTGAISLAGKEPWLVPVFSAVDEANMEEVKTFMVKSMVESGVLFGSSLNLCYAHSETDLQQVIGAFQKAVSALREEVQKPGLAKRLNCDLIRPVFSVR